MLELGCKITSLDLPLRNAFLPIFSFAVFLFKAGFNFVVFRRGSFPAWAVISSQSILPPCSHKCLFNVQNQSGKCDGLAEHGRKLLIEPLSPVSFWWANIFRDPWHPRLIWIFFFFANSWHSPIYLMSNTLYSSYLRIWNKSRVSLSHMGKLTKLLLNTIRHLCHVMQRV